MDWLRNFNIGNIWSSWSNDSAVESSDIPEIEFETIVQVPPAPDPRINADLDRARQRQRELHWQMVSDRQREYSRTLERATNDYVRPGAVPHQTDSWVSVNIDRETVSGYEEPLRRTSINPYTFGAGVSAAEASQQLRMWHDEMYRMEEPKPKCRI